MGAWDETAAYRDRFGWTMPWYAHADSDFGTAMHAGPGGGFGINAFVRDGERVFRTSHTGGAAPNPSPTPGPCSTSLFWTPGEPAGRPARQAADRALPAVAEPARYEQEFRRETAIPAARRPDRHSVNAEP